MNNCAQVRCAVVFCMSRGLCTHFVPSCCALRQVHAPYSNYAPICLQFSALTDSDLAAHARWYSLLLNAFSWCLQLSARRKWLRLSFRHFTMSFCWGTNASYSVTIFATQYVWPFPTLSKQYHHWLASVFDRVHLAGIYDPKTYYCKLFVVLGIAYLIHNRHTCTSIMHSIWRLLT